MQAKKITEHELVKLCMQLLCKTYGFADCENMIQRDLQFLCEQIEEKTGVLISLSTVKRLLNGSFSRMPQIATLDAVAMTLGYKSWQDFKLANTALVLESRPAGNVAAAKYKTIYRVIFSVVIVTLSLLCFNYLVKLRTGYIGNADKSSFSATKVTGNSVPNTVIFKYNVDSVDADSFFIQQSWDRHRRVRIYKNSYTLTDIYYEPGYHTAKLIANDKVIRRLRVSIPTDKWFFYAKEEVPKSIPKYISTDGIKDGSMQLTRQQVFDSKADFSKENEVASLYFPSKIQYSSDNFVLTYRVKVNTLNNEACPYLMSEIFCQNRFMYFKTTPKGCTSNLDINFGENFLYGKTSDLSALGSDVTNWQDMQFRVENKQVTISINGKAVFKSSFKQSCGLITGLGFISNGLSEVSFVDLKTTDGKVIYSRDFSKPDAATSK